MASGTTTLMILVMMSLFLWIMGYQSIGNQMLYGWSCPPGAGCGGLSDVVGFIGVIIGFLATGFLVSAAISGSLPGSFSVIYTVPILLFSGLIAGLFLLPLSFLTEPEIVMPTVVKMLLSAVFGVMILSTVISFIRGGEF